jgi:hypothetical protein
VVPEDTGRAACVGMVLKRRNGYSPSVGTVVFCAAVAASSNLVTCFGFAFFAAGFFRSF